MQQEGSEGGAAGRPTQTGLLIMLAPGDAPEESLFVLMFTGCLEGFT